MIGRRELITLLGGAGAAASPRAGGGSKRVPVSHNRGSRWVIQ